MTKEIELKFLVDEIPSHIVTLSPTEIHQTYLAVGNEEVRVRKKIRGNTISYTMTVKKGSGLVREETEIDITASTYNQLLAGSNKTPLIKVRHQIVMNGKVFELDVYENTHIERLKTIEVEFTSEEEAHAFQKPDWFRTDVTSLIEFKNQCLWQEIQMN